jgi:hypothetical protein
MEHAVGYVQQSIAVTSTALLIDYTTHRSHNIDHFPLLNIYVTKNPNELGGMIRGHR